MRLTVVLGCYGWHQSNPDDDPWRGRLLGLRVDLASMNDAIDVATQMDQQLGTWPVIQPRAGI